MLFEVDFVYLSSDFPVLRCALQIGSNRISQSEHFQVSLDVYFENIHHAGYES
jgi:hypothetical protein